MVTRHCPSSHCIALHRMEWQSSLKIAKRCIVEQVGNECCSGANVQYQIYCIFHLRRQLSRACDHPYKLVFLTKIHSNWRALDCNVLVTVGQCRRISVFPSLSPFSAGSHPLQLAPPLHTGHWRRDQFALFSLSPLHRTGLHNVHVSLQGWRECLL